MRYAACFQLPQPASIKFNMKVFFLCGYYESFGAAFGPAQIFDRSIKKIASAIVPAL
jgi:hypothetical protein